MRSCFSWWYVWGKMKLVAWFIWKSIKPVKRFWCYEVWRLIFSHIVCSLTHLCQTKPWQIDSFFYWRYHDRGVNFAVISLTFLMIPFEFRLHSVWWSLTFPGICVGTRLLSFTGYHAPRRQTSQCHDWSWETPASSYWLGSRVVLWSQDGV